MWKRRLPFLFPAYLLTFAALNGCTTTFTAPTYPADAAHVSKLRGNDRSPTVYLQKFTSGPDVMQSNNCRLGGRITLPKDQTWHGYVRSAIQSEFQLAQRYAEAAETATFVLSGELTKAKYDSNSGYWDLALTIGFADGSKVQEDVRYSFDTPWSGTVACDAVADAYAPAVQKLVGAVFDNPTFQRKLDL